MPGNPSTTRRRFVAPIKFDPPRKPGRALVVIDDAPLKRRAWAELHAARKRQEKAARDLHRHEQIDLPAYDAWLHLTFPTFITRLRELHQDVYAKAQRVETAQAIADMTGRPVRKIWREQKEKEANQPTPGSEQDRESRDDPRNPFEGHDGFFDDDDDGDADFRAPWEDRYDPVRKVPARPRPTVDARNVYRRLVQRLHPDRGGEWTAARQRLWHEVQLAWAAGDTDWLTRLEVEWEAAHDVLSPASPLSRLRCAVAEFHAARRDTERKLRDYRESPAWRFTLAEKKRELLRGRTAMNFHHDIAFLERQLAHLDAMIASWEKPSKPRRRPRPRFADAWF